MQISTANMSLDLFLPQVPSLSKGQKAQRHMKGTIQHREARNRGTQIQIRQRGPKPEGRPRTKAEPKESPLGTWVSQGQGNGLPFQSPSTSQPLPHTHL